jgi:nucleoside-diphosphate-sugar epimerase
VTKLAAEQLYLAHARRRASHLGVAVLRYFSVYGPRQRSDMLLSRLITAALTGVPVEVFGDGTQVRDVTHIDDVVAATLAAELLDDGEAVEQLSKPVDEDRLGCFG